MKSQVNIKLDPVIKQSAQRRAKELGLSLSAVVNATLSNFARTGEFVVSASNVQTPYLEKIVKESRKEFEKKQSSGPFKAADDMIRDLES